jgi:thiamine-phosphate diphosphorylase
VHDPAGAIQAERDGADFVLLGNVYDTGSKPGQPGGGTDLIVEVVRACRLPVIAIGGITPERVAAVLEAGAYGVAVLSGILAASDPGAAASRYRAVLEGRSLDL